MARKLSKLDSESRMSTSKVRIAQVVIIGCQHLLLWTSLYVVASNMYLVKIGAITQELLPMAAVMLSASGVSLMAISMHNLAVRRSSRVESSIRHGSLVSLRVWTRCTFVLTILAWIASCTLATIFVSIRHPFCSAQPTANARLADINFGATRCVQRASFAGSAAALLTTLCLLFIVTRSRVAFRCHLFGTVSESYIMPWHTKEEVAHPQLRSNMSFKCRSTSSLTLVDSSESSTNDLYGLYPTRPEKAYGLGMWAPQQTATTTASRPSFLAPRPSLKTIRSYTAGIAKRPDPESPMPKLPAYFPEQIKQVDDLVRQPRAALLKKGRDSHKTIRRVPPSPILGFSGLTRCESLSSVYSRDVSGIRAPHPLPPRPSPLTEHPQTFEQSGMMHRMQPTLATSTQMIQPTHSAEPGPRSASASSNASTAIDDVATLQARLPRASSMTSMYTAVGPEERALDVLLHSQCGLRHGCLHRSATGKGDLNSTCRWTPMEVRKRSHCIMSGTRQSVGIAV